jgi:large subunit ribosomal protein L24
MPTIKKIKKGDLVRLISGTQKGTTGKVVQVLAKKNQVLIEGVGIKTRKIKPSQLHPTGGHKYIHTGVSLHKVALVIDEKSAKTSRVGLTRSVDGKLVRVARQLKNKEIK